MSGQGVQGEPAEASFRLDLNGYLARIGWSGALEPGLETLNGIVGAHVAAIPFENLDVLTGAGVSVAPGDVERKLVGSHRGGYCFEQNTLLMHALDGLGFQVTPISGRVMFQKPRHPLPSRTHLFLRVELEGRSWLVDVGVGGLSPAAAIELVLDKPQATPHEARRIVARGDWTALEQRGPDAVLHHQALIGDVWETVAEFTLEEMHPIDVEIANWYTSAHPGSHFKNRLTVALAFDGGRKTLLNRHFKVRSVDGRVVIKTLSSIEEIRDTLAEEFCIDLPQDAEISCSGLAFDPSQG